MPYLLTLLLTGLATLSALAQTNQNIAISINDDTKTLSIDVSGERNGTPIQYSRSFAVATLTDEAREALKKRVLDSLGLGSVAAPIPPPRPLPPGSTTLVNPQASIVPTTVTVRCESCIGQMRLEIAGEGYAMARAGSVKKDGTPIFPIILTLLPGEYRYQYWQDGILRMQLPFTVKAGQTNNVLVRW